LVFEEAERSELALIIIDDFDVFLQFDSDGSYNKSFAWKLLGCLKKEIPRGHRLEVIATASNLDLMAGEIGLLDNLEKKTWIGDPNSDQSDSSFQSGSMNTQGNAWMYLREKLESTVLREFSNIVVIPSLKEQDEITSMISGLNPRWPSGKAEQIAAGAFKLINRGRADKFTESSTSRNSKQFVSLQLLRHVSDHAKEVILPLEAKESHTRFLELFDQALNGV
ncbi:MAG: hypothetical protein EZS28_025459, partial [Streblomastix strix]